MKLEIRYLGVALVLLLVPLMLLALPLPPNKFSPGQHKQDWVLGGAIVVAIASGVLCVIRRDRSTLPLIVLGTSLLLIATVVWNKSFRNYCVEHPDYRREVFRRAMRSSFHWPMYGRYDNAVARWDDKTKRYDFSTLPFVGLSVLIAGGWFWWATRRPLDRKWDARSLGVLMTFQLALIITFALCEPWPSRLGLKISGYGEFQKDLPAFTCIGDTLRTYVAKMPTLQWYGQHYPPGNLILIEIEKAVGVPGMTKSVVCLCVALTLIPLWKLTRELELDDVATSATLLLFAASSSVLIYCTINTTSLLLLPGTMCLWLLVRSLKTGNVAPAMALGFWFVVYLFFSFSASILGVLMLNLAAVGLLMRVFTFEKLLKTAIGSLTAVLVTIALLYFTTRFNLISCFIAAVRGHQDQQGNEGFDGATRYLIRSTGNVLSYLFSIVPLCILACMTMVQSRSVGVRAMAIAVGTTVLLAGFSGLFYLETERIWIFLTPAFALAAGAAVAQRSQIEGRRLLYVILAMVLLISCLHEFLFMHYR